jgi:hypothetical protein
VLEWWLEGTRARTQVRVRLRHQGRTGLAAGPDSARRLLAGAAELVQLVEEAGGQHNLEVSDRIFRESVDRVKRAYGWPDECRRRRPFWAALRTKACAATATTRR